MREHEISRKGYYVVKIDKELWDKMTSYLKSNYEKISVSIEREDSVDVVGAMNFAYRIIEDSQYKIKRIVIMASNEYETVEIKFNVWRSPKVRYSIALRGMYSDHARGNDLKIMAANLITKTRVSTNLIRFSAILFFYTVLIHSGDVIALNLMNKWLVISAVILMAAVGILLNYYVYTPIVEALIYGRDRIQFWVDDESIAEYKRMKKRGSYIGAGLVAVSIVIMILIIFV